tara:strand:+ start:928 stop:1416 length:489 start_codon:yes stop_codon:yes gene_type:complete
MRYFWNLLKKNTDLSDEVKVKDFQDNYQLIGNLVKEKRINLNLSINELSDISKIPKSTIIAIENNVIELRPQRPFIRSILLKLEQCLKIEDTKLSKLLKTEASTVSKKEDFNYFLNRFAFFNSWKVSMAYLLILLISIFLLNIYFLNSRMIEFKIIQPISKE